MSSFYWKKGFYLNGRIFFFDQLTFFKFGLLTGVSKHFVSSLYSRCEGFKHFPLTNTLLGADSMKVPLTQLTLSESFLLNTYLLRTFPVLLNILSQVRFNVWFFYVTKTYKGIALKINKPLRRRTRNRTYFKPHMVRPKNIYKLKTTTTSWF